MNTVVTAKVMVLLACLAGTAAHAEVAVIVNPKNPAATMTAEQVAQIYLGKSNALKAVDLPDSAPLRAEFYKKVTEKDAPQIKAIWAKLIFTGKATPPKTLSSSEAVAKAVAADVNAIGYIDSAAVDGSVKVVLTVR
jgi:ABC-type phosphate transport system substrate-binding protein